MSFYVRNIKKKKKRKEKKRKKMNTDEPGLII